MHKLESVLIFWEFETQTDYPIPTKRLDLVLINKKKRTFHLVHFAFQVDHGVKRKERKKINNYLDLARELKKQWSMKVMVILIVIGTLGTVPKGQKRDGMK